MLYAYGWAGDSFHTQMSANNRDKYKLIDKREDRTQYFYRNSN